MEELLSVRGITPLMLFGPDANRNGAVDVQEAGAESTLGTDNADGTLDCGWASYLTLYSVEKNVRPDGKPRIDLNHDDLKKLHQELEETLGSEAATFIVAYRQYGTQAENPQAPPARDVKLDFDQQGKNQVANVLDLIDKNVQLPPAAEDQPPTVLKSPFSTAREDMAEYLPRLMDYTTVDPQETIAGRININQAPRAVMLGIPDMPVPVVDRILASRDAEVAPERPGRRHATWILTEGIVTLDQMKNLMPFLTAGGSAFRTQVVGYFEEGGPAARIEAVLTTTTSPPRLLFWRDQSHLGVGFSRATLGMSP
jgi:hypothetical protein